IVFFVIFVASFARAEVKGHGAEVRLATPRIVEIKPGRIVSGSFVVSNHTEHEQEFFEDLHIPAGWQAIIPSGVPFTLESQDEEVRIVSFFVPLSHPAGNYEISYSVKSQRDYGITDTDMFSVVVLPVVRLEMLVEDKPESVIAGETYVAAIRLVNKGNSEVKIKLDARGVPDCPVNIVPSEMILGGGKFQDLHLTVKTDKKLNKAITHILKIRAYTEGPEEDLFSVEKAISTKIIPRVTGEFDPYHRLPALIRLIGVMEEGKQGVQFEFSGSGTLDEEGKKKIGFLVRGPDIQDKSIWGTRDEYLFSYSYTFLETHFGDRSYSLSPLTERYRYGRGMEVNVRPDRLKAGALYLQTRWETPETEELGTYVAYQFTDTFSIKGNFLYKSRDPTFSTGRYDDKIYSIEAKIEPNETMDLELEYGLSSSDREEKNSDYAYRIALDGQLANQARYTFEKIHAEPTYFGYYNDSDYMSGMITFPIYHNLRGNFSYRSYKNNLDRDPTDKDTANRQRSYRPGIWYSFPFGAELSMEYEDFCREDHLLPADFNLREKIWIWGLRQTFRDFTVQSYIERGKVEDRLSHSNSDNLERYSVYASFRPSVRQRYSLYTIIGQNRYSVSLERTKTVSASAAWKIKDVDIDVTYQRYTSDSVAEKVQENILSHINYVLPNGHFITFTGRWFKGNSEESSCCLMYTIPLGIPVSKKKSIGVLRGRVYDEESQERSPYKNVILMADGATAVTDQNGEFIFPALKPGVYYLTLEKSSIGLHRVTCEKLPIQVEVRSGGTTQVDIPIVTSCKISGRITLLALNNGKGALKEAGGLSNAILEITDGKEVLRRLSNKNGVFSFEEIRPGKWTLNVDVDTLPANHYLKTQGVQVELRLGEEKEVNLKVMPRTRTIQIIDEGEIRQENSG
ncbi:MAG: hypothetical protein JRJ40_09145, partial [Deltaproteobacteria bacterium]|nr:hypothetical protein [Deltaproteobacteria bacterium]